MPNREPMAEGPTQENAEARARESSLLLGLAEATGLAKDLESIYEPALDAVTAALGVRRASILLLDDDGVMRFKAWRDLSDEYRRAVEGHSPWQRDQIDPRPITIPDVRSDEALAPFRDLFELEGIRSIAFFPLTYRGTLLGKFMVYSELPREIAPHETRLALAIGTHISLAVVNARAFEALREAHRRKDEFLAVLSHELRNPLAAMQNSLYVLERAAPGSEPSLRAQAVVGRQLAHLTRLVDDLLDVTRIAHGKVQLQPERFELGELVRRTVEDHRSLFAAGGLTLRASVITLPLWVDADVTRMTQVVGNLLLNAAKFTSRGGDVEVSLEAESGFAAVRVRDNGVGIAPALIARIFEPFTQADATLARSRGGLGLGLALVKGLVELHGGRVDAASEGLGCGSTFVVRLPLVPGPEHETRAALPVEAARRRVLVIEDNVDAADALREVLELIGHDVAVAYGGPEGLAKARELRPEIVICDIGLPEMDGYQVARAIRADEGLRGVVLIALSGYALPDDVRRATEAGFDAHIAKPPKLEQLRALLAQR